MSSPRPLVGHVALRIVRLRVLLRLLAGSLRHPRVVVDRFDLRSGGGRIESLRRVRVAILPVVRGAWPVVAVVDRRTVTQHLLVVLKLLELVLVLVGHALRHVLRRASWVGCRLGALGEVMSRVAARLARPMAILVILVVRCVRMMEVALLLQVAR